MRRNLGGGGGGSDAPRMYCVAVMSPMSCPRGLVELTYPLVRLDWPRPYFSRNRGSFKMANALNVRSTDWQNVHSVIATEGRGERPRGADGSSAGAGSFAGDKTRGEDARFGIEDASVERGGPARARV